MAPKHEIGAVLFSGSKLSKLSKSVRESKLLLTYAAFPNFLIEN